MSKVITFSTKFQANHPKAGQPTYFVEKILKGLLVLEYKGISDFIYEVGQKMGYNYVDEMLHKIDLVDPKFHTIRAGQRFKVGDKFSPRIWSGRPYFSPQITIAPDITVEKTFDFDIGASGLIYVNNENLWIQKNYCIENVSKNDGLEVKDFMEWFEFPKQFDGQIICWNPKIEY